MLASDTHPSELAFDRKLLGLPVPTDADAHIRDCPVCKQRWHALTEQAPTPIVPAWVRELPAPTSPARSWTPVAIGLSASLAAAAIAVLVLMPQAIHDHHGPKVSSESWTTVRGAPSVGLFIKRGEMVWRWDGTQAVQSGDRLRLEVAPEEYPHVAVLAPLGDDFTVLYRNESPLHEPSLLPRAWEVDSAANDLERLVVVMSKNPLGDEEVISLARTGAQSDQAWIKTLSIPKRTRR